MNSLVDHVANFWQALWRRLSDPDLKAQAEVTRIGVLQQTAASRRAEYAEAQERAALTEELTGEASLPILLSSRRERMAEAEAAHIAALRMWENKQSRQKSH